MENNFSYLNDKDFLNKLFGEKVKYHYAKITLLDFQTEDFYKEFVGRVTAGSISLSATSAMRRTCNLTVVAEEQENDLTNIDGDISINKKFQLMVGYENSIYGYEHYGKIIWFPLGIYIFTSVSISRNASGSTISISGQDKMCLLNGSIKGQIPANTSFHEKYTYLEDGSTLIEYPTIFQIIQEAVNHFGGESLNNIVINDLENEVKQLIKYDGNTTLYYGQMADNSYKFSLKSSDIDKIIKKYEKNDIIGYWQTDFTYPGELIQSAGSNIVSLLQSIIGVIGNYEFFYDVYGKFHFQEIKNYLNTSYVPLINIDNSNYTVNFSESNKSVYSFDESELVISYSNTPDYTNIKNDFCIWGKKGGKDGIAIFYHLAIDEKPVCKEHEIISYKDKNGRVLVKPYYRGYEIQEGENQEIIVPNDWRYELYLQGLENAVLGLANNYYYAELSAYFPEIYDFENNCFFEKYMENPEELVYWLDFVTPDSIVGKLSVNNIGRRTFAVTDTNISAIYSKDIEDIIVINMDAYDEEHAKDLAKKEIKFDMYGQKYAEVDGKLFKLFSVATSPLTAYARSRELLQKYTYYNDSITLNSIPLYFLEPNTRITVNNKATGIQGDYIIQNLSLPLAASGQMTLTATKATTRL